MYTSGVTQTIGSIHTQRTRTCQSYSEWIVYGGMCQQFVFYGLWGIFPIAAATNTICGSSVEEYLLSSGKSTKFEYYRVENHIALYFARWRVRRC